MQPVIDVRAFHQPLADAGLVPKNCRVVEMSIGTTGEFRLRYEVFLTPEQVIALGGIFQTVGRQFVAEEG
jgi:hypothetical protein